MITFELEQTEHEKELNKKYGICISKNITIRKNGEEIGRIFSPSGSGRDKANAIQVCGFSEAFDIWGCGPFSGFKDIQLLFDDKKMEGEFNRANFSECLRCYMKPCQCENKIQLTEEDNLRENVSKHKELPFSIKNSMIGELDGRFEFSSSDEKENDKIEEMIAKEMMIKKEQEVEKEI